MKGPFGTTSALPPMASVRVRRNWSRSAPKKARLKALKRPFPDRFPPIFSLKIVTSALPPWPVWGAEKFPKNLLRWKRVPFSSDSLHAWNYLFSNYLGDYSCSFEAFFKLISITVTVSLFFWKNAVTGNNSPQGFSKTFGNYSYII